MSFRIRQRLLCSAVCGVAVIAVGPAAQAAVVELTTSDTFGNTSFDAAGNWSNGEAPSAAHDYLVDTGRTLRTPPDSGSIAFQGASLTLGASASSRGILVIKNVTSTSVTIDNLTLNGGEIQNGGNQSGGGTTVTVLSNGITLGTDGGAINGGAAGRLLIIDAPISGAGELIIGNPVGGSAGTITLTAGNSHSGGTTVRSGARLNIDHANALGTGTLLFTAGDAGVIGNTSGAPITLATNNPQTWNNNFTFAGGSELNLGTGAVTLGGTRTITVSAQTLTVGGSISDGGGGFSLTKGGAGTLVLGAANNYSGTTNIGINGGGTRIGVLRAAASGALGTGTVDIGPGGNDATARLELIGGIVLNNTINFPGRNNASVGIQSIGGNNTLAGTISANVGGGTFLIQSDADTLTLSGAAGGNVALRSASGSRTFTLQGAGNGLVSGVIENGAGTVAITKAGSGTWTLSGDNTYTGVTTILGGTLAIGASNRIPDASNMTLGGGTFSTAGFSETLGTLNVTANSVIDLGSGASILQFADSSALAWSGDLTIDNWSGSVSGGGTDQVFFGSSNSALTPDQLSRISFSGFGEGAAILASGEIVPVPEPASLALLGLGALGLSIRRRRR